MTRRHGRGHGRPHGLPRGEGARRYGRLRARRRTSERQLRVCRRLAAPSLHPLASSHAAPDLGPFSPHRPRPSPQIAETFGIKMSSSSARAEGTRALRPRRSRPTTPSPAVLSPRLRVAPRTLSAALPLPSPRSAMRQRVGPSSPRRVRQLVFLYQPEERPDGAARGSRGDPCSRSGRARRAPRDGRRVRVFRSRRPEQSHHSR